MGDTNLRFTHFSLNATTSKHLKGNNHDSPAARLAVGGGRCVTWHAVAGADVASLGVGAPVLTRTVAVPQQTLVLICRNTQSENGRCAQI